MVYTEGAQESDYTVLLMERGHLTPYLVLTDDFEGSGKCLLLRKYLLENPRVRDEVKEYSAYYASCYVDEYLDTQFSRTLMESLGSLLEPTEITITRRDALRNGEGTTERIGRRVFLLSCTEVGCDLPDDVLEEGEPLAYFAFDDSRVVRTEDGEMIRWALRSPVTRYDNVICGIDTEGHVVTDLVGCFGGADRYSNGIRPALCLDGDLALTPTEAEEMALLTVTPGSAEQA